MTRLFTPLKLGELTLPNRILVAPMCQYSAVEGCATDWHLIHIGGMALSGAGLLTLEATAVSAEGRISQHDLGLYSDANEAALARVLQAVRAYSPMSVAVQLAHGGRKSSSLAPWDGGAQVAPTEPGGWQTVGPSALPHAPGEVPPQALDAAGLRRVRDQFAAAARRAARLGFEALEIHGAHGYLLHEFLSPIANRRTDEYGGSLDNRMRFPLEVFAALRAAWPADKPLGARITGTDWLDGGIDETEATVFAAELKQLGCDYCCVSSGGIVGGKAAPRIPTGQGYQVFLADHVRRHAGIATRAVGMIVEPRYADTVIREGQADMIAIARGFLDDPRWGWHAAEALGAELRYPPQYERSAPKLWKGTKLARPEQPT